MKSRRLRRLFWLSGMLIILLIVFVRYRDRWGLNTSYDVGDRIDSLHGVVVFYNGSMGNTSGRHLAADGYNLGLNYQCVEFVKRFYYEYYHHQMPDTYGNAKDFFNPEIKDGAINPQRALIQFTNGSTTCPKVGDLMVFDGSTFNEYGHVAIVSQVLDDELEIIQQNVGSQSREWLDLEKIAGKWRVDDDRLLGWLRCRGE